MYGLGGHRGRLGSGGWREVVAGELGGPGRGRRGGGGSLLGGQAQDPRGPLRGAPRRRGLFSHVPLWAVYPQWGWTTDDAERALAYLRRFGSTTVLNGHIHQVLRKVEGNISFHTAMSTAFPQPAPGSAPAPGPMKIPEEQARRMIGVTEVSYVPGKHPLAVVDSTLG